QSEGGAIRVSGVRNGTTVEKNAAWKTIQHKFTISAESQEIVLVVELRSTAGKLMVDPKARLIREN
ncbi:MAG: hypothetical protein LW700_13115, partial [Gemmataceae bacterium]|nr:hypothetical protein [Gemmataceae bacterium]